MKKRGGDTALSFMFNINVQTINPVVFSWLVGWLDGLSWTETAGVVTGINWSHHSDGVTFPNAIHTGTTLELCLCFPTLSIGCSCQTSWLVSLVTDWNRHLEIFVFHQGRGTRLHSLLVVSSVSLFLDCWAVVALTLNSQDKCYKCPYKFI